MSELLYNKAPHLPSSQKYYIDITLSCALSFSAQTMAQEAACVG